MSNTIGGQQSYPESACEDLGYFSPQHLAAQFRQTYGTTASACRKGR